LLREPRRALHARIAEAIEGQFAETAESRPEILAHHCTEAGLIEKAAGLWGKAGQWSLDRSALAEAAAQFTRALEQIATLPGTPALRRDQIKLQVALITPLIHVKGYAAPETKAAAKQARLLIEQAEALGEPSEDPLLLFSVLYAFWVTNFVAFDGDVCRDLAAQFKKCVVNARTSSGLMSGNPFMLFHYGPVRTIECSLEIGRYAGGLCARFGGRATNPRQRRCAAISDWGYARALPLRSRVARGKALVRQYRRRQPTRFHLHRPCRQSHRAAGKNCGSPEPRGSIVGGLRPPVRG
jgi:hypothetical protein